jgi:hypothetical protein
MHLAPTDQLAHTQVVTAAALQKKDYRTFWKDRVETVRVWHSLYGGIEDDEYVARMLDDTFTIRGLENYVCDPAEAAENLDPKKNRYVQAVLRAQRKGRVDAHALHEEVKDITEASLRKAQALAILDAQAVVPARSRFAIDLNEKPKACPIPNSPNSVLGFDVNHHQQHQHHQQQQQHHQQVASRKMNSFDKKLLEHMDEGQRRQIIIEQRRNSMQLYQAEERRKSELQNHRRLSLLGAAGAPQMRRQSLSGVPSSSCALPPTDSSSSGHDLRYGKMMRGQRDSLPMDQRMSAEARQPTMTLKQHPRPVSVSYIRDSMSLGPRPSRRQSISGPQSLTFASPSARRGAQLVAASYAQQQQVQYQRAMEGRMFSVNQQQQQRRDSVYGTMITTPQPMALVQMQRFLQRDPSTYTEMIGGFPGMRRDSLAGHYEHS